MELGICGNSKKCRECIAINSDIIEKAIINGGGYSRLKKAGQQLNSWIGRKKKMEKYGYRICGAFIRFRSHDAERKRLLGYIVK